MFVTCLLLYYRRDSFTKLPCSKLLLFIHGSVVGIGASCLFDDHDCEMTIELLWPVRQL